MLSYHDLQLHPRVLRAFTSLDPDEFDMLRILFEKAWQDYLNRHDIHKKSRQRRYGGGRTPRLVTIEDKLLFILFYCKVYPRQEVRARLFGMSQGRANAWMYTLMPIFETALGAAQCVPERNPQNLAHVLARWVSVDFLMDGTEKPTHRPQDPIEQKDQYSGKKKAHGEKQSHW